MRKILNIVLSLSLLIGFSSCDKENGNGNGVFNGTERNAVIKSMVANFADYSTKSTDNNVVSKSTAKIDNEYSLEVEVVDVTNTADTKAPSKLPADFGIVNVEHARAYTMYSKAYTSGGKSKIKVQNLDFVNAAGVADATLQVPVDDANCRLLIFADVEGNAVYPELTTDEFGFNTLTVTSGSDSESDVNLCYYVAQSSDFPAAPEKASLTLTPLFSQIYNFEVANQTVVTSGTPETVTLVSAELSDGMYESADVTIDVSNIPGTTPKPELSNFNRNTNFAVNLEKTPVNFIPKQDVNMKLKLSLTVGGVNKNNINHALTYSAEQGHRYEIKLSVKKDGTTPPPPADDHFIYLLSEHYYDATNDPDYPDGLFDAYDNFGDGGIIIRTIPASTPIVKKDTATTTIGEPFYWDDTDTKHCLVVDNGTVKDSVYVIYQTDDSPIAQWIAIKDPITGKRCFKGNPDALWYTDNETVFSGTGNVFYRFKNGLTTDFQFCIRKNKDTKGKRFIFRFIQL